MGIVRVAAPIVAGLALAPSARAGGLEVPDRGVRSIARGGAFVARADDATAVDYNPGALSKLRGFHLTYNHDLLWSHSRFTRAESSIPSAIDPAEYGVEPNEPVENGDPLFPLGAFLAATHDFGLDGFTFAFSAYGPHASGKQSWPVKGGQRYMLTELEALLAYAGPSVAWGTDEYGVGATLQYVAMPSLKYSLVVDGQPGPDPGYPVNPYVSSSDVEATLELSDWFSYTAIVGAWWRPMPDVEIGLSGRVIPVVLNGEGDIKLRNVPDQTEFAEEDLEVPGGHASLEIVLPPTARLGARYRHLEGDREVFDVEIDLVYEAWHLVEAYEVDLEGQIILLANEPAQDVTIEKRWRDTFSVRIGSTVSVVPDRLRLSAGGFWERGASPHNYTHLDFLSLDRIGLGGGAEVTIGDVGGTRFDVAVSYSHIFQEDRTVTEERGKVVQQRPVAQCPGECDGFTGVPANAGEFESSYDVLAFGVTAHF